MGTMATTAMITVVPSGKKEATVNNQRIRRLRTDLAPPLAEGTPVVDESDLGGCTLLHSLLDVGVQFLTNTSPAAQLEEERNKVCSV